MKWKFLRPDKSTGQLMSVGLNPGYKLAHYLKYIGHEVVKQGPADIAVNWDLSNDPVSIPGAINGAIRSVRKDIVDALHQEVFGYCTMIDPSKHRGFCVRKSTQQATHTGQFIKCPVKPDEREWLSPGGVLQRFIYQRAIDNRIYGSKPVHEQGFQLVRDYRVSVVFGQIPAIYIKDKAIANTFHPHQQEREYYHLLNRNHDDFSKSELNRILSFSKRMGIDIAELDVLRDNGSGRIYIIDVNNIAMGSLFKRLPKASYNDAMQRHQAAILENISKFVKKWD